MWTLDKWVFQQHSNATHICGSQVISHHDKNQKIKFKWCHIWNMIPKHKNTLIENLVFASVLACYGNVIKQKRKSIMFMIVTGLVESFVTSWPSLQSRDHVFGTHNQTSGFYHLHERCHQNCCNSVAKHNGSWSLWKKIFLFFNLTAL